MRGGKQVEASDKNILMRLYDFILSWKINGWWLLFFLLADAALSFLVVKKIPCKLISFGYTVVDILNNSPVL